MKLKKYFKYIAVVAFAIVMGYSIYESQKDSSISDLALANVEALARYELPEVDVSCGSNGGACWAISGDCYITLGARYDDCEFCGYVSISCNSPCLL